MTFKLDFAPLRTQASLLSLYGRYAADETLGRARARATQMVPGEGTMAPLVLFVGEAPGEDEDKQGRPFVGRSGQYLDEVLAKYGIDRLARCYTTNLVKYWPGPGNPDPGPYERYVSLPYLEQEIELLRPPVIATLGRISGKELWPSMPPILRCHGDPREYGEGQVHLPMLHPSYALRGNHEPFAHDVAVLAEMIGVLL